MLKPRQIFLGSPGACQRRFANEPWERFALRQRIAARFMTPPHLKQVDIPQQSSRSKFWTKEAAAISSADTHSSSKCFACGPRGFVWMLHGPKDPAKH